MAWKAFGMAVDKGSVKAAAPWLMLLALVIFYIGAYAPLGLENNDGGFMLGLSFQLFKGQHLYSDVLYVRPPMSPWLHEFVFFWPFSAAPVWSDRVFFYVQMAVSSLLSSLVAGRFLGWGRNQVAAVAAMGFMLSTHVFPAMGWHTVDGIFFFVLSLYALCSGLNRRYGALIVSAACAVASAACKQPFYIVPPLILLLAVILQGSPIVLAVLFATMLSVVGFILAYLQYGGLLPAFVQAISSQTNLQDLYQAGVLDYVHDISGPRFSFVLVPLGFGLFAVAVKMGSHRFQAGALLFAVWLVLLMMARHYWRADTWAQPFSLFDAVFVVTLVCSLTMVMVRRDPAWMVIAGMHGVAWASSISWGNQTSALYAVPSAIVIGHFLWLVARDAHGMLWWALGLLPVSFVVFLVGHQYVYSLEGPVRLAANVEDMGRLNPALTLIRSTPRQQVLYREFMGLRQRYFGIPFVVMPNMPMAHLLVNEPNPIGVDWVLNVEVGKRANDVVVRLKNKVGYAFIRKNAIPSPQVEGKFGSDVSLYVMRHWRPVSETSEFVIYKNPMFFADTAYEAQSGADDKLQIGSAR